MFRFARLRFPKTAHKQYMPLMRLGKGVDGDVFLCLPRADVPTLPSSSSIPSSSASDTEAIRSKFVAVKLLETELPVLPFGSGITSEISAIIRLNEAQQICKQNEAQDNEVAIRGMNNFAAVREVYEGKGSWQSWYAMDFIGGCSLRFLAEWYSPLPAALIAHIFVELHAALIHLRSAGITHGDLNARNVMLMPGEKDKLPRVILLDFGLARDYHEMGERADAVQVMQLMRALAGERLHMRHEDDLETRELQGQRTDAGLLKRLRDSELVANEMRGATFEEIWHMYGGLAEKVVREGKQEGELWKDVKDEVEREVLGDNDLKSLVREGGAKVEVFE